MLLHPEKAAFNKPSGFIVIDGLNGAGKSTLQKHLAEYLVSQKIYPILTREPGATPLGKTLRELLLNPQEPLAPLSEVFLFAADRSEHVNKVIIPGIKSKKIVISDRYYYSTIAFQGYGRGLEVNQLLELNLLATQKVRPDLAIILDLEPSQGLSRAQSRSGSSAEKDSFESEELEFHKRLRNGFLEMAKNLPEPFLVLNAAKSQEQIFAELKPVIDNWIQAWRAA